MAKQTKPKKIALDAIMLDDLNQSRVGTDAEVVEQYAEAWREGAEFPPVDLFSEDGQLYYVGDGHHRAHGAVVAQLESIAAVVHSGDQRAAAIFACSANKTHGLYRSNADKRNAVARMLELEPKWSNRRIAEHVGVGHTLVSDVRNAGGQKSAPDTRVGRDGRDYVLENKEEPARVASDATPPEEESGEVEAVSEPEDLRPDLDALAAPYKAIVDDLNRHRRTLLELTADETTGAYLQLKAARIEKHLDDLKAAWRMAEPMAECEDCYGVGCDKCSHTGFITRAMQEAAK